MALDHVGLAMMGATVLWAVVSIFSRFWGGVLGAALASTSGAWGWWFMGHGGRLSVVGFNLTPGAFYSACSLITLLNVAAAVRALRPPARPR